jgi:hypothetical protein
VSGDLEEALARFNELHAGRHGHVVVKLLVVEASERKSRECEMASVLLSAMTKFVGSECFFEGFIRLLRSVDDLALDSPGIATTLTNFIARAIVDDVLPPCFFSLVPGKLVTHGRGQQIQVGVRALLERQGSQRVMQVWGSGANRAWRSCGRAWGCWWTSTLRRATRGRRCDALRSWRRRTTATR